MGNTDIDILTDEHIESFEKELKNLYSGFDNLPEEVQLGLFDMIFNLGATTLGDKFPSFNKAIKEKDWTKAAKESNRPDVNAERNKYVRDLFDKAAENAKAKEAPAESKPKE